MASSRRNVFALFVRVVVVAFGIAQAPSRHRPAVGAWSIVVFVALGLGGAAWWALLNRVEKRRPASAGLVAGALVVATVAAQLTPSGNLSSVLGSGAAGIFVGMVMRANLTS